MLVLFQLLVLSTNPALEEGRRFYSALKWDKAEQHLRLACDVPSATPQERYEAYDLLARTLLASGRTQAGEETYAKLLSLDPMAPTPAQAAPKIREAFRRAKERLFPRDYALVRQLPSAPDRLALQVVDPWGLVGALVLLSSADASAFTERPLLLSDGQASVELEGASLRWYVEARAVDGRVLAELGSKASPNQWWGTAVPAPSHSVPSPPAVAVASPVTTATTTITPPVVLRPRWVPWAVSGLALAAVGAGVTLGVLARTDVELARAQRWGSDTVALSARAQSMALGANLAYGGAALSAITAAILFWVW